MYAQLTCDHCNKSLKVREENLGQKVRCPYCHQTVQTQKAVVPTPEPAAEFPSFDLGENAPAATAPAPAAAVKKTRPAAEETTVSSSSSSSDWSDGTNISMLKSAPIGLGLAVGFYLILLPFYKLHIAELFLARGWVPYAEVFLMGWSAAILLLKNKKIARQKESILFDLLPTEIAADITPDKVGLFVKHIRSLPADPRESFLLNRVLRGLEHFRVRKSNPEVVEILSSQSEIDANAVDSSYSLLKVFIWAIPILGFIGTVIGISAAVGGFSGSLDQAQDISVLKDSLNNVTGGLSTAFDTTLIALVMSMIVMFPTSSMQKVEEDVLNWVDEYCNENLIKRLDDGGANRGDGTTPEKIQQAVDKAMTAHHAELKAWSKKLESIGMTLTKQVLKGWGSVDEKLQKQHEQQIGDLRETFSTAAEEQQQLFSQLDQVQVKLAEVQEKQLAQQQQLVEQTIQQAEQLQQVLSTLVEGTSAVQTEVSDSLQATATSMATQLGGLEQGLQSLNNVLVKLGEQQVVIQTNVQPGGRGLFGWLGKKNGRS